MRAVFLDRDGVLNANVLNPETGEMESPHEPKDFYLLPNVVESLKRLQDGGYALFVVSNQPSFAKGKASLENIEAIAALLKDRMEDEGISISEYFYCLHHPNGVIPEYSGLCQCRKPSPYFLRQAEKRYDVILSDSWMVGDRDTDIKCGQAVETHTIRIASDQPDSTDPAMPDYIANDLAEAADIILAQK